MISYAPARGKPSGGDPGPGGERGECRLNGDEAGKTGRRRCTLPGEEECSLLADLFKTFGDVTRIRILYVLSQSELCVSELAETLDMTSSAISHQLRILKQSRLIKSRRDGKMVYYSLDDEHVRSMLDQGMEHVRE